MELINCQLMNFKNEYTRLNLEIFLTFKKKLIPNNLLKKKNK